MNTQAFKGRFAKVFTAQRISGPSFLYGNRFARFLLDPCRGVQGMASIKKLKLLNLAFACLEPDECYLEVGTYLGKSLIAAMKGNPERQVFACDNFSEFGANNTRESLLGNLKAYQLDDRATFYNADFLTVLNRKQIPLPVGLYFYDGAHDHSSQYNAIKDVEPLLADEALVIVDDWRFAPDSQSYAKVATEKAISESVNTWQMLYDLPARYNGDLAMWWNGVAVYSFKRNCVPAC